jgi:hypothetical protein
MRGRAQGKPGTCSQVLRMPQMPRGVVLPFPHFEYGTLQVGGKAAFVQNPLQTLTSFFTVTFASSARSFIIAQDKPAVAALNHLRWVPDEECNPMPIARLLGHGRPCRTRPG